MQQQLQEGLLEEKVEAIYKDYNLIKKMEEKTFEISHKNSVDVIVSEILGICKN